MLAPESKLLALRTGTIRPFYVMELMKQAAELERTGRSIIHLSIGEPDFGAPTPVLEALARAMQKGRAPYTAATGLPALRQAIADYYAAQYDVELPARRIVVTAGASGALLLAMAALVNPGDEVLMPDPCYPCNRHFVHLFDGVSRLIPAAPQQRFQLSQAMVEQHWSARTRGVLIASPSNPTGTSIAFDELGRLIGAVRARGGFTVVDEIYQGLSLDGRARSALEWDDGADDLFIVNSFSKYFCMTGWRLGWLVVPEKLVPVFERLSQNLYICASSLAQEAALACFTPETLAICEERRLEFRRRRDIFVPALRELGYGVPVVPDGAFYIYADCSAFTADSSPFATRILNEAGVCLIPGKDFGENAPERWLRLSFATSRDNLAEAVRRLSAIEAEPAS
jgi:aspartate/methionine/tyrosine aminotransferase